ncbi:putative quinol monooxygenase [Rhodococcus sp. NCIMB 12038]|uniref:putative quinol monooxygenase n=1 Tax=Rhodococcus sp. NCIMB 12038 TaxID=933800 RepID=UPI000B3CE3FB|nr:putative quinol monooxygenase [Rhodococcus sp. NCIMB 12038]OUS93594.1 antibiotic biosynthesis monooxygenase [Rhodococcus sp. NCIMB 12038]
MIFIVVNFTMKPDHANGWLDLVQPFTDATRNEPGNLWFYWSRSVNDPNLYVLVEAFRDDDAAAAHVQSEHFQNALRVLKPALARTPRIINTTIDGTEWSQMGELEVD